MVSRNPLFRQWTLKTVKATVIQEIWPGVFFFSLVATMVSLVSSQTRHQLVFNNGLLTVLGIALGFVISFRTSSAYEKYQDGRKLWTNIITASRNMGQFIWIHIPDKREKLPMTELQSMIEKKTLINLVLAFAVSVKHSLRQEEGIYYEDLYPLISTLPQFANAIPSEQDILPIWKADESQLIEQSPNLGIDSIQALSKNGETTRRGTLDSEKSLNRTPAPVLEPAKNPPQVTLYDVVPFLRFITFCARALVGRTQPGESMWRRRPDTYEVDSRVPLSIFLYLSSYSDYLMRHEVVQPAIASAIANNLAILSDTFSALKQICSAPLPFAYQVHLRMTLWIYLFFLPFQLYTSLQFVTIPATAFAAFLLLGFLEIGQQIENPFNYDLNDLDLDYFCHAIQRELHEITAHTSPEPAEFIFSEMNQPLAPSDRRNASELSHSGEYRIIDNSIAPGSSSIKRTLLRNWRDVDNITREML